MEVSLKDGGRTDRADASLVQEEIARAIARIRFGSVVVQIQDGVVVQIESTEKRRFPPPAPAQYTRK